MITPSATEQVRTREPSAASGCGYCGAQSPRTGQTTELPSSTASREPFDVAPRAVSIAQDDGDKIAPITPTAQAGVADPVTEEGTHEPSERLQQPGPWGPSSAS